MNPYRVSYVEARDPFPSCKGCGLPEHDGACKTPKWVLEWEERFNKEYERWLEISTSEWAGPFAVPGAYVRWVQRDAHGFGTITSVKNGAYTILVDDDLNHMINLTYFDSSIVVVIQRSENVTVQDSIKRNHRFNK